MLSYPDISPEIFSLGPITLRWYGFMYVVGYVLGYHILKARIRKGYHNVPLEEADGYITHIIIGMLLGARLVYVFVYNWDYYSLHPGEILALWSGGLSFHGAMLGMIVASWLYARKYSIPLHSMLDSLAIGAAPALFFGRIGNFINGELYGRPTESWVGMVFPTDPEKLPRFPSQVFQGLTEGLLLFIVLCVLQRIYVNRGKLKHGMVGAWFVAGYGIFRFIVEYTRQPDPQLGYLAGGLTMGQILCSLMVVASVFQMWHIVKTQKVYELRSEEEIFQEQSDLPEQIAEARVGLEELKQEQSKAKRIQEAEVKLNRLQTLKANLLEKIFIKWAA